MKVPTHHAIGPEVAELLEMCGKVDDPELLAAVNRMRVLAVEADRIDLLMVDAMDEVQAILNGHLGR